MGRDAATAARRVMSGGSRRLPTWVLLAALATVAVRAAALEPERSGQENFIKRATFADGRLWLLTDAGALSSLREGEKRRLAERLPGPVLDMCVQDGGTLLVVSRPVNGGDWIVRRRSEGGWPIAAEVRSEGDGLAAMGCDAGGAVLLTSRRLVEVGNGGQRTTVLSGRPSRGAVPMVYVTVGICS